MCNLSKQQLITDTKTLDWCVFKCEANRWQMDVHHQTYYLPCFVDDNYGYAYIRALRIFYLYGFSRINTDILITF